MKTHRADVVVLGAGPGGTGPLFAAIKRGDADKLLAGGVRWLERGDGFAEGCIAGYRITSDTQADVLFECLPRDASAPLGDVLDAAEKRAVEPYLGGPLPLACMGAFLARAGRSARALVEASPRSGVHGGFVVEAVHLEDDGYRVTGTERGERVEIRARSLISALGGVSPREEALDAVLPDGRTPRGLALREVFTTDELFRGGVEAFRERLPKGRPARFAVLGGSHSAYATANKLLTRLGPESCHIQVLCRRLPKIFYPTLAAAHAEGYTQATERDVCPVTKRVFRLAGLRLQGRDLVRRILGLGDAKPEPNVAIVHLPTRELSFAGDALLGADVVILALGYRARTVPFWRRGERVPLSAEKGHRSRLVDGQCRLLDADAQPIPGAYGLGLASGFVPHGPMGGEPSFDGQTNGLWLYQNDVGARVLDQVLASSSR